MSVFGEALASLYSEIVSERSERAQAASDRVKRVAEIARKTQGLLSDFAAERSERAEEFRTMSKELRKDLAASVEKLREDVTTLQAEARQEAHLRAAHREAVFGDLHTRLATFSDKLQTDIATQLSIARKARMQAQAVQDLAASAVKTSLDNVHRTVGVVRTASDKQNKGPEKPITPSVASKRKSAAKGK